MVNEKTNTNAHGAHTHGPSNCTILSSALYIIIIILALMFFAFHFPTNYFFVLKYFLVSLLPLDGFIDSKNSHIFPKQANFSLPLARLYYFCGKGQREVIQKCIEKFEAVT